MAVKIGRGGPKRALIALALPLAFSLAVLVPLAVPFGAGPVSLLGRADAATVKRAAARKIAVRKSVPTKRVCTTRKIKGKLVKRCKAVRLIPPLPRAPFVSVVPPPTPVTPLPVQPQLSYAPPPSPLPVPPPYPAQAQSAGPAAYFWIDQADSYAQAIGNSPPDFSFECGGVDCWAWISRAGEVLIIEPARDGVLQYFYAPRETSPYLARDSYTSFAFDGRDLVQVYDNRGRVYTSGLTSQARYEGQALQQRGRALFAASLRQRRWDRGTATAWSAQSTSYGYNDGWNSGWGGAWRELPGWDRYGRNPRYQHPPRQLDDEHRDRRDARRRYDDWHRRGDQGAPPPTGNPVVTPGGGDTAAVPPRRPRPVVPQPVAPPTQPVAPPLQPVAPLPVIAPPVIPPPPVAENPPPRPHPRRDIEAEPGVPPLPHRAYAPPADQPVRQIEAAPVPAPVPVPAPAYDPAPAPAYVPPPAPAPTATWSAPLPPAPEPPRAAPVAAPAPPPPDPPAREQYRAESPIGTTEPQ